MILYYSVYLSSYIILYFHTPDFSISAEAKVKERSLTLFLSSASHYLTGALSASETV